MTKRNVLANDENVIDVMEWNNAPHQGYKKGKQHTQLELGLSKLSVKDTLIKLENETEKNREHQAPCKWRN